MSSLSSVLQRNRFMHLREGQPSAFILMKDTGYGETNYLEQSI